MSLKKQVVGHCLIHGWMIIGVNARYGQVEPVYSVLLDIAGV
jgi:hypothetical protein